MRVAIIGCGNIAQVHAWSLSNLESVEIVALADPDVSKAEQMSAKFTDGKAVVFVDYEVMLEQVEIDVVHICTPHYLHVPMAMKVLNKNINVFMEKPPAISQDEFEQLVIASEESKASVGFCFQNRYNATTVALDEISASGEMGEVIGARGFVTWKREADYYSDDWHGSLEKEGGGALINQSIHTLDLLLRYLGEPVKVEASMRNHHLKDVIEVEDTMEAWMEFDNGKRACFYASTAYATDAPVIIELSFERGRVTMLDQILQVSTLDGKTRTVLCSTEDDGIGKSYWGKGHLACIKDYYSYLKVGGAYSNGIDGIANTLRTTMRIYDSARRGEQ